MVSHLERLFASFSTEVELKILVSEKREEDLYLEFKQKADRRNGILGESDRSGFSQALSGFANADGGVLIFGIETSRSRDGVDCAVSLKPITDHALFRSRLMDLVLNTTQPVVDGILIDVVTCEQNPNTGYVKCMVPPSDRPPHLSIHSKYQYWRRIATGHRRMEHYELEDVFGRRLRPVLQLFAELRLRQGEDPYEELYFFLLNEGRGIAKHVGFHCNILTSKIESVLGSALNDSSAINNGKPFVTYYNANGVIHANGILSAAGHAVIRRENKGDPLELKAILYAENMQTKEVNGTITPGGLAKLN